MPEQGLRHPDSIILHCLATFANEEVVLAHEVQMA